MTIGGTRATLTLLVGDIAAFVVSLWLALALRYGALPPAEQFFNLLTPFGVLFVVWVLVFYIAGLYSKSSFLFRTRMVSAIFNTQLLNIVLAALFFFAVPYFGIAPKTILAIYLLISLGLIFFWRLAAFPRLTTPSTRESAAVLGVGEEVNELVREINGNSRYPLRIDLVEDPSRLAAEFPRFAERLRQYGITLLIADIEHKGLRDAQPLLYDLVFARRDARFIDFHELYEEVFDRVPLSFLTYEWFLANLSQPPPRLYLIVKRLVDIVGALVMGLVTLVAAPFVWLAMLLEDRGPLFIAQERIGTHDASVRTYKFRSMSFNDAASASWVAEGKNRITRVGAFLRLTSLDEFPQFVNILAGELSLVGPRNDIRGLGERLAEAIPYYDLRYLVKPGITGWAQINQRYEPGNISPQSIAETKMRLAYDFYYIKHRSLSQDIVIMLRTLKRMFFRIGSL